ncbi:hypothetical protein [Ornithinimicrobium kibberense]|uniref:hypothetical protein n=1 Tax=Ornithinimicrobium kibberense TaxID=282060 RepID=UPI00361F0127
MQDDDVVVGSERAEDAPCGAQSSDTAPSDGAPHRDRTEPRHVLGTWDAVPVPRRDVGDVPSSREERGDLPMPDACIVWVMHDGQDQCPQGWAHVFSGGLPVGPFRALFFRGRPYLAA